MYQFWLWRQNTCNNNLMSKSISKHLYFPTDLKIEVKHFLNGSIIWLSSYIYVLKKIIFSSVDINAKRKEHQLKFYLKNYYLNFYSLPPIPLKKKSIQR